LLCSKANVVIGSRYIHGSRIIGWSSYRKLLSRGANFLARTRLNLSIHDVTTGFRVYSRRAVEIIAREANRKGYEFQVEAVNLVEKMGLDMEEIPITFTDRFRGKSKLRGFSEVKGLLIFTFKQVTQVQNKKSVVS
jgi:dolichol-phosphate mannosyltransferase